MVEKPKPKQNPLLQVILSLQTLQEKNPRSIEFLQLKEYSVNCLIDFFLKKNRERMGKNFDEEKEKKQRQAIKAMLEGKHLQGETGLGKDSVILPIVSIIEALTSPNRQVILSSAKDEKVNQYPDTLKYFLDFLPEEIRPEIDLFKRETEDYPQKQEDERFKSLRKKMFLEALDQEKENYTEKTFDKIRRLYWGERLTESAKKSQSTQDKPQKTSKPKITIAYERDLVFKLAQNPRPFAFSSPRIFLDEAHIPYDRNTPYVVNFQTEFLSFGEVREGLDNWTLSYLINDQIKDDDFIIKGGRLEIKDEKKDQLLTGDFLSASQEKISNIIYAVSNAMNLSEDEKNQLERYIMLFLSQTKTLLNQEQPIQEETTTQKDILTQKIQDIFNIIPLARFKKGEVYIYQDEDVVRDSYTGSLLPSHRFQPLFKTVVGAVNNKFILPSYIQLINAQTHYQTFLYHLKDKITVSSGTLLLPTKNGLIKGPFAKFIKDITGREIFYFPTTESKTPPSPFYFEEEKKAYERVVEDIKNKQQPTLIVCFNENDGSELEKHFSLSLHFNRT